MTGEILLRGGPFGGVGLNTTADGGFRTTGGYLRVDVDGDEHWWIPADPATIAVDAGSGARPSAVYDYYGTVAPDDIDVD